MSFETLPNEVTLHIFQNFSPAILNTTARVNKHFLALSRVNSLWQNHFERDFPDEAIEGDLYKIYNQKMKERIQLIQLPVTRKLCVLIEENNLDATALYLNKIPIRLTEILKKSIFKDTVLSLINVQNFQSIRDFFFWRIYDEYQEKPPKRWELVFNFLFSGITKNRESNIYTKEDQDGWTLYHWACALSQLNFLHLPQMKEISPDQETGRPSQKTPLILSIESESLESVTYLIDQGANVNIPDHNQKCPIEFAMDNGSLEIIKLLVKQGASLFPPLYRDICPLKEAVRNGYTHLVHYYLDNFLDQIPTRSLEKALELSVSFGHYEMLQHLFPLMEFHADELMPYINFWSNHHSSFKCLEYLVKEGGNANFQFLGKDPILFIAVYHSNYPAAKLLLEKGANPNFTSTYYNETPLDHAVSWENFQMVNLLVDHGATISNNSLKIAKEKNNIKIFQLLREAKTRGRGTKRARD